MAADRAVGLSGSETAETCYNQYVPFWKAQQILCRIIACGMWQNGIKGLQSSRLVAEQDAACFVHLHQRFQILVQLFAQASHLFPALFPVFPDQVCTETLEILLEMLVVPVGEPSEHWQQQNENTYK